MSETAEEQHAEYIVIGAGIAGLMAALVLSRAGRDVLVVDKGRGVGGRMATRRIEGHRFDHGAQSVQISDSRLATIARQWLAGGIAQPCDYSIEAEATHTKVGPLCGVGGMNSIPKAMAEGMNVVTGCRVTKVSRAGSFWHLETDGDLSIFCDSVILTPPMPQSLDILRRGQTVLPTDINSGLDDIAYDSCIAVLAVFDASPPDLPSTFAAGDGPISLMVDNFAKGVSPREGAVTIHMSSEFSRRNWDVTDDRIRTEVLEAARPYLAEKPVKAQVHRWRYSRVVESHPERFLLIDDPGLLAFAGDGFSGKDIEGAALSGVEAARALLLRLK